jgi:DTW domain-containing protein YfiP
MLPPVETRLAVHVLIHRGEQRKPSSTGTLVARVVTGVTQHVYQRQSRFFPPLSLTAGALLPGRDVWILHPHGEPLPAASDATATVGPQVVLLDGTWRQAGEMLHSVESIGRCVRLPDEGLEPGRFWLRDQPGPGQFSTAEALAGVLAASGEHDSARHLRLHFELHVYAMLLARGRREMAERYLGHSPLLTQAAPALDRLHAR